MDLSRIEILIGKDGLERLKQSRVAIFGLGGAGSFCLESLVRSGIGQIDLFDNGVLAPSDINRQLFALYNAKRRDKVFLAKERILRINPKCIVTEHKIFYDSNTAENYRLSNYDYIVDTLPTINSKIELITRASSVMVPVISCIGLKNKSNPQDFLVANISKRVICPLAKEMQKELKSKGINSLKIIYSKEKQREELPLDSKTRKNINGSLSYVYGVVGLLLASEVIKDLALIN